MFVKLNQLMTILKEAKKVVADIIANFKQLQIDDDGLTGENICYFDDSQLQLISNDMKQIKNY